MGKGIKAGVRVSADGDLKTVNQWVVLSGVRGDAGRQVADA